MKKLLSIFFIFTITTLPALAATVSGTVLDENNEPLVGAGIYIPGSTRGTTTDINGKFELKDIPDNAKLEVSFTGYKTQTIQPNTNQTISMQVDVTALDDVVVSACRIDKAKGIKAQQQDIGGDCYPSECVEPRWTLSGNGKNAKCVEQKCEFKHGTGKWEQNGDKWECKLTACDTAKGWKKNDAGNACIEMLKQCTPKQIEAHPNATKTGIKKGTEDCIAQECKCGYDLTNDKCVEWSSDKQCTNDTKPALPSNAKSAVMKCDGEKAYCEISDCNDGYKVSDDKKSCLSTRGDACDATAIDKNATAGINKTIDNKTACIITDCAHGYKPNKNGTKCVAGELSEEDSQAKIDELKDNAQKMKEKEQSTANKLLGAAGIGATGIGGMQMASAMAEENADADAERAMRAYLATFHCNYGGGKNIAGGEQNVELPGGNELISLYSEYVNLANDLKARKTALDMRPGIESETILDAATSGLYDDVAIGKTSGAYTSLARALMDPTGADAAAWAEQKEETASKKKTGVITAGVGAAGSLVGNLALNSGKNKQNKLNEILNKYDKKKQILHELESDVAAIPEQTAQCPSDSTGTYPNCTCTDKNKKRYVSTTNSCEPCEGNQIVKDGECTCPDDKPNLDTRTNNCFADSVVPNPQCDPNTDSNLELHADGSCTCRNGFNYNNGKCECQEPKTVVKGTCVVVQTVVENKVIKEQITTTVENAILPAGSLFKVGSYELVDEAKTALNKFVNSLSEDNYYNCELTVKGYTDPLGGQTTNKKLSENRAEAVKKHIDSLSNTSIKSITAAGYGEEYCTCGAGKQTTDTDNTINGKTIDYSNREYSECKDKAQNYTLSDDKRYAPCRRVEISANCTHTTTTTQTENQ